jgi:hypothetical protein
MTTVVIAVCASVGARYIVRQHNSSIVKVSKLSPFQVLFPGTSVSLATRTSPLATAVRPHA